jgi:hypothetical protein
VKFFQPQRSWLISVAALRQKPCNRCRNSAPVLAASGALRKSFSACNFTGYVASLSIV